MVLKGTLILLIIKPGALVTVYKYIDSEDDNGDDGYGWFVGLVDEAIGLRTLKIICRGHRTAMLRSITELKMPNLLKLCLSHSRLQTV